MLNMFNPFKGKDMPTKLKLSGYLLKFSFIPCLRLPYVIYKKFHRKMIIRVIFFLLAIFSKYLDNYMINKSNKEWAESKEKENGSEMFLFFIKG